MSSHPLNSKAQTLPGHSSSAQAIPLQTSRLPLWVTLFLGALFLLLLSGLPQDLFAQSKADDSTIEKKVEPGTTTAGPEGSEVAPKSSAILGNAGTFGIGATFGQTLLSGDDADTDTGYNSGLNGGVWVAYRLKNFISANLAYSRSIHDGKESVLGDLTRSQITGEMDYYIGRGLFAPYWVLGAGIYQYNYEASNKILGLKIDSSSGSTFGILAGAGIDFEVNKHFVPGIQAIYHHSFNQRNSDRDVTEANPFFCFNLRVGAYF